MASISASVINENLAFSCNNGLEVPDEQLQCLRKIKHWVQSEAEFYGRTDDDFLLMFLRSCDFELKLTKKTLTRFYENRRDIPQWWANRNVLDEKIFPLLQLKMTTIVNERNDRHPTVGIIRTSNVGPNLGNFDEHFNIGTIYTDVLVRRRNSQKNGIIWILDCRDYKWWFVLRLLNPVFLKLFCYSFYVGLPSKIKTVIVLNTPTVAVTGFTIFSKIGPPDLKTRIHYFGSDWSKLGDYVPMEIIPEEYGGQAGPIDDHFEYFIKEVLDFNDYLLDDNKYGFQE